jgi:GTPase SAR1 family protein
LWRSKLVLVGQGGAGKTSLVNALNGRHFTPGQPSTVGLELSELSLPADRLNISELTLTHPQQQPDPLPTGERMRLSVWDFGGQEIYHATHQFFLTARSLFLVVWDPNAGYEYSRLPYWLNTVTARAPDAPILLVATHGDQRPADLPLEELRRKYPAIVGAFTVDSASGHGIDALRAAVARHAAGLPLMGASWPKTWAAGADALRARPEPQISLTAARTVLAEHHVADNDHAELLSALTFLGDVLHYPHEPSLADTVVLDPQWLNSRIARILDSKQVAARGGTLLKEDVHREWADLDPALHEHS